MRLAWTRHFTVKQRTSIKPTRVHFGDDIDGDGITNSLEAQSGFNPWDANCGFRNECPSSATIL